MSDNKDTLYIVDSNNNVIATIDENGINTTNLHEGGIPLEDKYIRYDRYIKDLKNHTHENYAPKSTVDLNSSAISVLVSRFTESGSANSAEKVSQFIQFDDSGEGNYNAETGVSFNGTYARRISYNTIGAVPATTSSDTAGVHNSTITNQNGEVTIKTGKDAYQIKTKSSGAELTVEAGTSSNTSIQFKVSPGGVTINDKSIATEDFVNNKIQNGSGSSYDDTSLRQSIDDHEDRIGNIENDYATGNWVNTNFAKNSDIPTYYMHTISITGVSNGTANIAFTVMSKSSTAFTVASLYNTYGSKAFAASGYYNTNMVSKLAFTSTSQARFVYGTGASTTVVGITTLSDTVIEVK